MVFTYSVILNDAYYYLNLCKGLPDIPSSEPLLQRHLRASVLFSWIAVEEILHHSAAELLSRKVLTDIPSGKLSAMLAQVLAARGAAPLDMRQFRDMRRVRNSLTHPATTTTGQVSLNREQVRKVFEYCVSLAKSLTPGKLILEPLQNAPMLPTRGSREWPNSG